MSVIDGTNRLEYNNSPAKKLSVDELKSQYDLSLQEGWISPLCGIDNYINQYNYLYDNLIGKKTSDGVEIKAISKHFKDRVIGTGKDPIKGLARNGTPSENIVNTLLNSKNSVIKTDKSTKRTSKLYRGDQCEVSINPETGVLIQCNLKRGTI